MHKIYILLQKYNWLSGPHSHSHCHNTLPSLSGWLCPCPCALCPWHGQPCVCTQPPPPATPACPGCGRRGPPAAPLQSPCRSTARSGVVETVNVRLNSLSTRGRCLWVTRRVEVFIDKKVAKVLNDSRRSYEQEDS